ncbi:hypothetical protein MLD38_021912 [Melastoma candidum]|uniref:Uncharacterized protein n=1 Tax=Melastoma candidum TaxID=119954 RepID=A0ACB9QHL5_9MYRT|nr:hypothetical protein MLD38_021912 [Melastoma candidum]
MSAASLLQSPPSAPSLPRGYGRLRLQPRLPLGGSSSSIYPSLFPLLSSIPASASTSRLSMRLASPKQAYICRDCGYIYNDKTPFEKLADKYFCPVCGAPKRRFKPYTPAVSRNANETEVRKERKAQIKRDEAIGQLLPIGIIVGVVALAGLYFYLNSVF